MKPGDFVIGLRELLSFVVPGAALLLLLPGWVVGMLAGAADFPLARVWLAGETARLFVFFFAAYATGATLSALGAIMDQSAERFGGPRRLFTFIPSVRASLVRDRREAMNLARLARKLELVALAELPVTPNGRMWGKRAFWWNYLRVRCPAAVAEVDRLEAQQKLFRSLMVAAALLALLHRDPLLSPLFAVAAALCFMHFANLRRTLTRRLFQCVVVQFVPDLCGGSSPKATGGKEAT